MRVPTLAVLSLLSMSLASAAVWASTQPSTANPDVELAATPEPGPSDLPAEHPAPPEAPPAQPSVAPSPALSPTFLSQAAVLLEGRLGHAQLPAGAQNRTYLFVEARGDAAALARSVDARPPTHLALVIDRSGSMEGRRQRNARAAATQMIHRLRDGDTVSVVTYSDFARVMIPATTIDAASRLELAEQVERRLRRPPSGSTCISCGIERALKTLEDRPEGPGVERILLLSDGEANRGRQRIASMSKLARKAHERGVSISSVGVDVDYDERLMSALARESNGHHHFSPTSDNLDEIFDAEFQDLLGTVASDAKLVIAPAPGVRVTQVFDRSFETSGDHVIVDLGNLVAEDRKPVLIELELPPEQPGDLPVADVILSYSDLTRPDGPTSVQRGELGLQLGPAASPPSALDAIVLSHLTTTETASALASANRLFARGQSAAAQEVLERALSTINTRTPTIAAAPNTGHLDRDLDEPLAAQLEALEGSKQDFKEAATKPTAAKKKKAKKRIRLNLAGFDDALGF